MGSFSLEFNRERVGRVAAEGFEGFVGMHHQYLVLYRGAFTNNKCKGKKECVGKGQRNGFSFVVRDSVTQSAHTLVININISPAVTSLKLIPTSTTSCRNR